jgi:putative transposase
MTDSLLIVTPHSAFGASLRQSLETSSCRVHIAGDADSAIVSLKENHASIALLDMALSEEVLLEIGKMLRVLNPRLKLVILSPGKEPENLDDLRPWIFLRQPVTTDALLRAVAEVCPQKKSRERGPRQEPLPETAEAEVAPPWIDDATRAAQHLTRLTLESSAQATLIVREGKLWAYAGQLSQPAAEELAATVAIQKKEGDLLRFVRLEATQADHMLYATHLASQVVLAMVFDAETPFSTIRSQATRLADSLSVEKESKEPAEEGEYEDLDLPPIEEILSDLPTPDPATPLKGRGASSQTPSVVETQVSASASNESRFSKESSPAIPIRDFISTDKLKAVNQVAAEEEKDALEETAVAYPLEATVPVKSQRPPTPVRPPAAGELDETVPHSITEVASRVILEPESPSLYNLTYACLLVPRFDSHHLAGDIAESLSRWMPQICLAFGWRLEYLAVRPDYLQWVVNVPPNTSPGYLMRIMRQQTSKRIFEDFPRLKKDNPSGDFWAPGYLIMGSAQPHPSKLVQDYIQRTRKRQGIPRK